MLAPLRFARGPRVSPTFRSLSNRNYRLYASGAVVSNVGTWMQRVAQDWLFPQVTPNNRSALRITTRLPFLAILPLPPYSGLVGHRIPHPHPRPADATTTS